MALDLQPTFVWNCQRLGYGSQVCPAGRGYKDADMVSFNSANATPQCSVVHEPAQSFLNRYGRVAFPEVTGSAPDRPAGIKLGANVSTWALGVRASGRAFWIALAWRSPYESPYTGIGSTWPMFQDAHTTGLDQFGSIRCRTQSGQLQTTMVQNNGSDTITQSNVTHAADVSGENDPGHAQILAADGNVVEFFIQATPNDPNQSAFTHKHNMSVCVRTRSPSGAVALAPTLYTHFSGGTSGSNAWNTRIEEPFHAGRTIGENATDGYRGDLLACAAGALQTGAMLSSATEIGLLMDRLWSSQPVRDTRDRGR